MILVSRKGERPIVGSDFQCYLLYLNIRGSHKKSAAIFTNVFVPVIARAETHNLHLR